MDQTTYNDIYDFILKNQIRFKGYSYGMFIIYKYDDAINLLKHLFKYHRKSYYKLALHGSNPKKHSFKNILHAVYYEYSDDDIKYYYVM